MVIIFHMIRTSPYFSFCIALLMLNQTFTIILCVSLQDGHDLPPPIGFDVETPTTIPPCKVS